MSHPMSNHPINVEAFRTWLGSERRTADHFGLVSALAGECYHEVCGLNDAATEAYALAALGLDAESVVCPSPLCGGRGSFQEHPTGDPRRCPVCRGAGVIATPSVAVVMAAVRDQIAA